MIPEYGWRSHPAVRMWMGYVPALTLYGLAMVDEWTARGGEDTTREKIMEFAPQAAHPDYAAKIQMPPWLGDPDFHLSHRSRLIAKDPRFYTKVFPGTDPDLEYVWPEPKHELVPEDPAGDRMWVLRLPLGDTEPEQLKTVSLPPVGRAKAARGDDDYQFVYADRLPPPGQGAQAAARSSSSRSPPASASSRKRRSPRFPATPWLPSRSTAARSFAVGKVLGRPITVEGQFARNFQVDEIVDRSAFDYPALLQDPRVFFPIPAR